MNYLTTKELSKKWNLSSRSIAYYCEEGRISGAVKKGKTWLIPANVQKPIDKRKSISTAITIEENIAEKGTFSIHNKAEIDDSDVTHYARDLYRYLGLTRETLRYYEEIGLIEPKRNIENLYREFDNLVIDNLDEIDFLKKRGFSPLEIKNLRNQSNYSDTSISLKKKLVEVEQSIYNQPLVSKIIKLYSNTCKSKENQQITPITKSKNSVFCKKKLLYGYFSVKYCF